MEKKEQENHKLWHCVLLTILILVVAGFAYDYIELRGRVDNVETFLKSLVIRSAPRTNGILMEGTK